MAQGGAKQGGAKIAKKTVRLDCGNYVVRTVTTDDASDRWAEWMTDPEAAHMLNVPAKAMTKSDLVSYIKSFDQRTHMLLGIFEKSGKKSEKLLGFLRVDIDQTLGRFLVSMMIGEPDYRNKGVTNEITVPFRDYFYETLGLKTMLATALSHNQPIIHYLLRTGWHLDKKIERHVKSNIDGTMLDLCFFSQSREAWRAWKAANLPGKDATAKGDRPVGQGLPGPKR